MKSGVFKFILFSVLWNLNLSDKTCKEIYTEYILNYNPIDTTNPFGNTAIGFNNLGSYETCLQDGKHKYILLKAMSGGRDVYMGLCMPNECANKTSLREFSEYLVDFMAVDVKTIEYINSEKQIEKSREFGISKVLFLVLFVWFLRYIDKMYKEDSSALSENKATEGTVEGISLWECFCSNFEYLNMPSQKLKELNPLKGLRFFLVILSLFFNFFSYVNKFPSKNEDVRESFFSGFLVQVIFNGLYILHLSLGISGFIQAYSLTQKVNEFKELRNKAIYTEFKKTLLKVVPVFLFVSIFYINYLAYFIYGPVAGLFYNQEVAVFTKEFPFLFNKDSNGLLHIGNLLWVVSLELQLNLLGIILFFILTKSKKWFFLFVSLLSVALIYFEYSYIIVNRVYPLNILDLLNSQDGFYKSITANYFHYFMGFVIAVIFSNFKSHQDTSTRQESKLSILIKYRESTFLSYVSVIAGYLIILCVIFLPSYMRDTESLKFIYSFILRKFTVVGLFMIFIPIISGKCYILGGWLGDEVFTYLNRLSLSVFVLQHIVIRYVMLNIGTSFIYNLLYNNLLLSAICVVTVLIAMPIATIFEVPFIRHIHSQEKTLINLNNKTIKIE
jgi:hypothetical protein